ncbi:MAG: hypothetical protein PF485_13735 [Bacteroidales bacterium]|jgi:CHASE3 domain sensor protein|nr:hypothetical protein [Bacteroidales bacterium]
MKKLTFLIVLISILGFTSCGSRTEKKDSNQKEELSGNINDCDEFLLHYEKWIDEYLEIIDSYFKNPTDETMTARYMELMQEGMEWSTKWVALVDCADDEKYEKRFEEISKKVENKLKDMGL